MGYANRGGLYNLTSSENQLYIVVATDCFWITAMIFQYPTLTPDDTRVIGLIHQLRDELRYQVSGNPLRWTGFLRRNTFARALQGSNSIEGINANLAEAVAIVDEERPDSLQEETIRALSGYRTAMTYILRLHNDPYMELNTQFIRSLHYMMLNYDMTLLPGQWRPGPVYVVRETTGETVYEGPDPDLVPGLMQELVEQIATMREKYDATVVAAMSHLNLAMIHPFRDGNGRMARALQTLVLARNGVVSPEFCSIEEWLGRNTEAYYKALEETGQGRWHPEYDAHEWVRFCLVAHYQQAATLKKRSVLVGRVWNEVEQLLKPHGLPDRVQTPLVDAAFGYIVRNQRYRTEHGISEVVASRDLKQLCDVGLLEPVGEKRGRYYVAGALISPLRSRFADRTRVPDPYDLLTASDQLNLGI